MKELDVIKLTAPIGAWPVGTRGTIVDMPGDVALVEISDQDGVTLDMIQVPVGAAEVVWSIDVHRAREAAAHRT